MISSLSNATVKATVRLQKRRERDRRGSFLVEGRRAVAAALSAGVQLHEVFHLQGADASKPIVETAARSGATLHEVSPAVMAHLTDLRHPPDVLAVAPLHPRTPAETMRG
ncbi:MAG: RNA methyltransferase substrate-binding domain-containing protein, partial [Burkholderiales bacterium]